MEQSSCVLNRPDADDILNKTFIDYILSIGTLGDYNRRKLSRALEKQEILANMEIAKYEACKRLYWHEYHKKLQWY